MTAITIARRQLTNELSVAVHDNPLANRLLQARGVTDASELEYSLKDLPLPDSLPGIQVAVERLARALTLQQRIMVVGDYDCDGATSTALVTTALTAMGAKDVRYLVPNRFDFGYGLSPEIVAVAAQQSPDLILTVDNGVASVSGVAEANRRGIDVVVTDHHLPPDELPAALAIVNPNLRGSTFPSTALAGVGVIFYVMLALRAHLSASGWFATEQLPVPNLAELLDLVAIGTVADVVPLDRVNRTLVEQGLRRVRAGSTRPGVLALIDVASRSAAALCATDIGFALGPRLNAAGRLDDIGTGIECLVANSREKARSLATTLNDFNQQRREIEQGMQIEAATLVEQTLASLESREALLSLCLFNPDWHQGVIGILAGRLKEQLNIPVLVFAQADDGSLKGSGRSIPGFHIRDALDAVATANPTLVQKFGGHAMAAGLSLAEQDLAAFRQAFNTVTYEHFGGKPQARQWLTDGELLAEEFNLDNARLLRSIAPWGQEFPEPLFDGVFSIDSVRILKEKHLKLSVTPVGGANSIDAIAFNQTPAVDAGDQIQLVYSLQVNSYRDRHTLQLMVKHLACAR